MARHDRDPRLGSRRKKGALGGLALAWIAVCLAGPPFALATAPRYPPAVPKAWHAPRAWLAEAECIHGNEAAWTNHGVDWLGNPSPYYGGYQFLLATWASVGGRGYPDAATPREQTYRAWLNWRRNGERWSGQWGRSARICGLR